MERHENPDFLKEKYNLHTSPEVETAAVRTEKQTGEEVPQDPASRIQNYLDRLEHLALDPGKEQERKMMGTESRPRALSLLRDMVMNRYVRSNKEKMATGAARVEERAARNLGIEARYGEEEIAQRGEIAVADLEKSLDNWIMYLSDANEPYPTWFRYYAFRNVVEMGDFDKDKGEFTKRSPGTTRLFPDIDRGALAYVQDMITAAKDPAALERLQKAQRAAANEDIPAGELLTKEKAAAFAKLSFAKQYAEGIRQSGEITPEMKEETRGEWIKYQKGTDPSALWASLQNKGTAWCTKGFATAETQLNGGDFLVYYTLDSQGKPTIPRIAIRMQDDHIGEVRGVADSQQNLEGNMVEIAEDRTKNLPGAEDYKKKSADMKMLTAIEQAVKAEEPLTKEQLCFLYEIDAPIEGFGYKRDPRIAELRSTRNPEVDMLVVFECSPDQIAHNAKDITEDTRAYVGKLVPGIFQMFPEGIEHIYTTFPENRVLQDAVGIGGTSKKELLHQLIEKGIKITDSARDMLQSSNFTTAEKPEVADLVRLSVESLGFPEGATTKKIFERAEELGLKLCPAEVGPRYRLKYADQPMNKWFRIGMKYIINRVDGHPNVFYLGRNKNSLCLDTTRDEPDNMWHPPSELVVRLRRKKKEV
jgi:hypothetical protein